MRKLVQITLAVLLVAVGGVTIGWQVLHSREREPVYQGNSLSSWLLDSRTTIQQQEADEAVRQAGTNAIPILLRMLRAKDSALMVGLMNLAQRQRLITVHYTLAAERNYAGRQGFEVLGAKAQSAVPGLIEIFNQNISFPSQRKAIEALGDIGPAAKEAVPSLLRWAATNIYNAAAISALDHIDPEAAAKAGVK